MSRSMTRESPRAVDWRSLATSRSTGRSFMALSTRGAHTSSSVGSASSRVAGIASGWCACRLGDPARIANRPRCPEISRRLGASRAMMVVGVGFAHTPRLERDGESAHIERGIGAVGADERSHGLHVGVGANHIGRRALAVHHGGKGNRGRCLANADEQAGILLREEPLGDDPGQKNG